MENETIKGNKVAQSLSAVLMLSIWSIVTSLLGISILGWLPLGMMFENGWGNIPKNCVKALV